MQQLDSRLARRRDDERRARFHAAQPNDAIDPLPFEVRVFRFNESEHLRVEAKRAFEVGDDDVDMVNRANHARTLEPGSVAARSVSALPAAAEPARSAFMPSLA